MESTVSSEPCEAASSPARLAVLAVEITDEHVAATAAANSALHHARAAGKLLIEAKSQLPHGSWEAWLAANTPVSRRMCQLYMQLSREWPRVVEAANAKRISFLALSISAALALLREQDDEDADTDDLGPGGADDDEDGDGDEEDDIRPDRYTRTVVLYFDNCTYTEFMQQVRALETHFGTDTITDTVRAAVGHAHETLLGQ